MTCLTSLHESASKFDAIGLAFDAEFTRDLARDCAAINNEFGSDKAAQLYGEWSRQLAVRAVEKSQQFLNSQGEAGGGSHQPNKQPARYSGGAA